MSQPYYLLMELTGIPVASSGDTPQIDLSLTLKFDEAWQPLMEGRLKFGLQGGQLKLTLENAQLISGSELIEGEVALSSDRPSRCEITRLTTEPELTWRLALKPPQSILKGALENLKLGQFAMTGWPCRITVAFESLPKDLQLTDVEGLWLHDISPNKHAILERKLAIALEDFALKPQLSRTVELEYQGIDQDPLKRDTQNQVFTTAPPQLVETLHAVLAADTNEFLPLANLAKLDPAKDFVAANLLGVTLTGLDLCNANLSQVNLRGADLCDADLTEADLNHSNLAGADLSGALLSGANLTQADLHRCSLALANLSSANLRGANLQEANLSHANLSDVDLSHANLQRANLHQARLLLTNLENADLTGANVEGARFKQDAGLSPTLQRELQQRGAIFADE